MRRNVKGNQNFQVHALFDRLLFSQSHQIAINKVGIFNRERRRRRRKREKGVMGCKDRDLLNDNNSSVSSSLSDALLFTTMCIVGLPVDVQVKDGSVYSGIFHTACVENDYGIILKKATLIKKGRKEANLPNGAVIDTLVILSDDLVQVIAKGVMIPADGIAGSLTGDDVEAVSGSVRPLEYPENELRIVKSSKGAVEVLPPKRSKNSRTRSRHQEEKRSDHGLMRTRVEADLPIHVDKGHNKKAVAAMPVESAMHVQHRKADDVHSTLIDEASSVPAVTVHEGQVERNKSRGGENGCIQKFDAYNEDNIHGQCFSSRNESTINDASLHQLKSVNGVNVELLPKMSSDETSSGSPVHSLGKPDIMDCERPTSSDFLSSDDLASAISSSSTAVVDIRPQTCSNPLVSPTTSIAPKGPATNVNAKEFKLNAGAKTFSPVFSAPRSAAPPAVATVASMPYIPNGSTVAPVVGLQPETGISTFTPHPSLPLKFLQYNNMVAVNGGSGSQYSPPMVGHVGSRPQSVRYAGQYTPLQAGPPYVHPNPQAVMVGRMGQLVYVHPVSHDVFQGAANPSAHALFTTPQVQLPKQQGIAAGQALQICVTPPPFMASSGQQPFSMPVHIPLSQPPFATVRPIPVPGANCHYGSKFI